MNDELSKLQRELDQATSDHGPTDGPLDAETASLRETWSALGQLLDTAYPPNDKPIPLLRATRSRGRLWVLATLAASLLVVIGTTWVLMGIDRSTPSIVPDVDQPAVVQQQQKQPAETDSFDWDDSLDQQIASAGQAIVRVQQDWYYADDAFSPVQDGLEEINEDIQSDML